MLRYSKRMTGDEEGLKGCDQKEEETSVEEKALATEEDLDFPAFSF